MENNLPCVIHLQMESGQGDLGTLANVVTSLANLSDSLRENLNNGDTSDSQHEEQSASEITRSVSSAQRGSRGVLSHHFNNRQNYHLFLSPCVKLVNSLEADYLMEHVCQYRA